MKIGALRVCFLIHEARSLKQKRSVVRSLKDRLLNKYNISVAEIGSNDLWQRGELGIVTVANDHQFVDSVMNKVKDFISLNPSISVIDYDIEIIKGPDQE